MSIKKDNISVTAVKYNNQDVNKVILNNNCVWCRPFTYTQGALPTGVKSLVCRRSSTDEPTASTGEISNNGTIYYYDKLYWDATASAGYRITAVRGSGSPVTVSGAITGTTASGVTAERISGTISQGKLPAEVASITCYRKAYNGSSFAEYTGSTIYYGDQFYWTATASIGYNDPRLTYNSDSKVYTWKGSQGGSITSVAASGLVAGSRKSFTISFGATAGKALYGSWSKSSQTAYYGDKITVSGTTVTCYKWDNTSTTRWTVTVSASPNTAQYTYSAPTIVESSTIASVTKTVTITAYNKRTLNSYTVTFSTTSGQYGSWSTASIANVPYGTAITRSGNTVTVGSSMNTSTFTPAPTTVQYNYASPSFSVPSSVTGATNVTGGCERSDRLYTIQWIGADGSTVLETDSNVKYGAVLTYNGSTPSKPSTAQYSYAFSAWKLGSTSGSTVTSGSTTNAGSTSSTTIKIYSTFTSTVRSYTITWSYLSAYPNTWTTDTQSYNYGATPSRTSPSTVTNTSNNERKVFTFWDNLNTVTGNRTITANYKTQFAPTIKSNYCEANRSSGTWYDSGTVITWTANDNYSFYGSKVKDTVTQTIDLGGTYSATPGYVKCTISGTNCQADKSNGSIIQVGKLITWTGNTGTNSKYCFSNTNSNSTTDTAKVELGTTSYSKAAYHLWYNVTSVTGTHCSAYNSDSYKQGFSTGWYLSGTKIYWKTTEAPYAMTDSNKTTLSVNVQAGSNNRSALVKQYTLTLYKNDNVSSIFAWRTKSPYQGAAISSSSSPLINGAGTATIYYGDSISMQANANTYYYFSGGAAIINQTIDTVTRRVAWSPTIAGVTTFKATIAAGTGVSSVYLSTNQNALSGKPSGTEFPAGTQVYAFAVINTGSYTAPSGWSYVGNGNTYRVGSAVMGFVGSPNFGTINATPKSTSTTYSLASGNAVTITLPSGTQMRVRNYGSKNDPDLYFSADFDLVVVADDYHWGSYELYGYPALAAVYIYNHNGYEHGWADEGDGYDEAQFIINNYTPIGVIRYNKENNSITVSAS